MTWWTHCCFHSIDGRRWCSSNRGLEQSPQLRRCVLALLHVGQWTLTHSLTAAGDAGRATRAASTYGAVLANAAVVAVAGVAAAADPGTAAARPRQWRRVAPRATGGARIGSPRSVACQPWRSVPWRWTTRSASRVGGAPLRSRSSWGSRWTRGTQRRRCRI